MENNYKRGDIHPITSKIFWCYRNNRNLREYWCTPEAFLKLSEKIKISDNTEKSKNRRKEYHKNTYYPKKREEILEKTSEYQKIRVKLKPLTFLWYNARRSTKHRFPDKEINITPEYLQELWDEQKGKCYYTGITMLYQTHSRSPIQPSLDRINNNLGYIKGNIAICCQSINYAKNNYNLDEFLLFLKSINVQISEKLLNEIKT